MTHAKVAGKSSASPAKQTKTLLATFCLNAVALPKAQLSLKHILIAQKLRKKKTFPFSDTEVLQDRD